MGIPRLRLGPAMGGRPRRDARCRVVLAPTLGLALALLSLASPVTRPAHAEETGTIMGKVVNATQGGGSVADLEVQLRTLAHLTGEEAGEPITTRTDADGAFAFDRVATAGGSGHIVTVRFQGVAYGSDVITFAAGETAKTADVMVYEPTSSGAAVQLRQQHLVIEVDRVRRVLKVLDISIIENSGDTTYVGKDTGDGASTGTFRLQPPRGARDFEFAAAMDGNTMKVAGGLVYTAPLLPGETELVYMYVLDFSGRRFTLTKTLPVPAGGLQVLVEDGGAKVTSGQLTAQPPADLNGRRYLRLSAADVAAGVPLSIEFSDLEPAASSRDAGRWLPPAGLAIVVGLATYFVVARRRRGNESPLPEAAEATPPHAAHAAGTLDQDEDDEEDEDEDDEDV